MTPDRSYYDQLVGKLMLGLIAFVLLIWFIVVGGGVYIILHFVSIAALRCAP